MSPMRLYHSITTLKRKPRLQRSRWPVDMDDTNSPRGFTLKLFHSPLGNRPLAFQDYYRAARYGGQGYSANNDLEKEVRRVEGQ